MGNKRNKRNKKEKKKEKEDAKLEKTLKNIDSASKSAKIAFEWGTKGLKLDLEKYNEIKDSIEKNSKSFHALYTIEDNIRSFQKNMLTDQQNGIKGLKKKLDGKSLFVLDFNKWQTKKNLNDLKNQINLLLKEFDGTLEIVNAVHRIENAIETMMDIYSNIEGFIEKAELANLMSALTNSDLNVAIPEIYQENINALKKTIHGNIIFEKYNQALEAFKYWSFPFFCEYTRDIVIYNDDKVNADNIDSMISSYANSIKKLLDKMRSAEIEIKSEIDIITFNIIYLKKIIHFSNGHHKTILLR
jgi:hypothetical protein